MELVGSKGNFTLDVENITKTDIYRVLKGKVFTICIERDNYKEYITAKLTTRKGNTFYYKTIKATNPL